jgi:hypothetical protein
MPQKSDTGQLTAKLGWFGSVLGGLFPHRNA